MLCESCRRLVARIVTKRFGYVRFGGRSADYVQEVQQGVYEQLLRPSGIASFFRKHDSVDPAVVFPRWLSLLVVHYCNNFWRRLTGTPPLESYAELPLRARGRTPEEEFDYQCAVTMVRQCIERVRNRYLKRGRLAHFETFSTFLDGSDVDYLELSRRLGRRRESLRRDVCLLGRECRRELRKLVADTLPLPPPMTPGNVSTRERLIDEEVARLHEILLG